MKKLMIAASAALCATVVFGDVESANVVGYQEIAIPKGSSLFIPTFKTVNGDSVALSQISVVDADGNPVEAWGEVCVQKMTNDGLGGYDPNAIYDYNDGTEGWSDNEATLNSGEAVLVNNIRDDECFFRISGEVDLMKVTPIASGSSLSGNPNPTSFALGDLRVVYEGGEDAELWGEVCIQKMTTDGLGGYDPTAIYDYNDGIEGWSDNEVEIEAGEGFLVNNICETDVYFVFPDPTAKKE